MRRFDVYESPSARDRDIAPYVVVLQSHHLAGLPSVVVAPLLRYDRAERFAYLSVEVQVHGERFIASLHELIAVDARSLKTRIGDVASAADAMERGLQRLFSGF